MFLTCNPTADAERWEDARQADADLDEAMQQEAQDCAPAILQAQLDGLKPGEWFKTNICLGAMWSPDEMLCHGIEKSDDLKDAVALLMTCTTPEAAKVRRLMAELFGKDYAMAIYEGRKARH